MSRFFSLQLARLDRIRQSSTLLFIGVIGIESLVFGLLLAQLIETLFPLNQSIPDPGCSLAASISVAVVIMPIFETFVFQCGSFWFLTRWKLPQWIFWVVMIVPFAAAHLQHSSARALGAGVVGGAYLDTCYVLVRQRDSFAKAFCVTAVAHGLHNLLAIILGELFPG